MTLIKAIGSGLVGACVLTLLHETVRRLTPEDAPRADILGMRAIEKGLRAADLDVPNPDKLHQWALAGDLAANSIYYSLIGAGRPTQPWWQGAALGLAAGVGAVTLPGPMGLGSEPSSRTPATVAMTIGWYLAGGLAAAAAYELLKDED